MVQSETYFIPVKIESESNKSDHWSKKSARKKVLKLAIRFTVRSDIEPPCHVILTRVAPRFLDAEDNLPAALKYSKDCIADILIPGLAPGRADESKSITWEFCQRKGKPQEYGLEVNLVRGQ
jgi:hypothetical protein